MKGRWSKKREIKHIQKCTKTETRRQRWSGDFWKPRGSAVHNTIPILGKQIKWTVFPSTHNFARDWKRKRKAEYKK